MMGSGTACMTKGNGFVMKLRKKLPGRRFVFSSYKASSLRSLNKKAAKLRKEIAKSKSRFLKKRLKKDLKELTNSAGKLVLCAQALDKNIGCGISATLPDFALVPGHERSFAVPMQSNCGGTHAIVVVQNPAEGTLTPSGMSVSYSLPSGASVGA